MCCILVRNRSHETMASGFGEDKTEEKEEEAASFGQERHTVWHEAQDSP